MAGITHIADFTSRIGATTVPQAGFGVPLLVGFHTHFPELCRSYSGDPSSILSAMEDDGFAVGENLYEMARRMLTQEYAPRQIKIGRLTTAPVQAVRVVPVNLTEGSVYELVIKNFQGEDTATHTVGPASTATAISLALTASIVAFSALTSVSAVAGTGGLTIDSTTGTSFRFDWSVNGKSRPGDLTLLDQSTCATIATQLSAVEDFDPDFNTLHLEVESPAISEAVGDWIAARAKKMYLAESSDSNATGGGSTDIGAVMLSDENNRVAAVWDHRYRAYRGCALAGTMLPRQVGKVTWALKRLRSDESTDLVSSHFDQLQAKRYTVLRAINSTLSATEGGFVGGDYVYIDILRAFDWTEARSEEAIANMLLSNDVIPFTLEGLTMVRQAMERVVSDAISQGVLSRGNPDDPENDPVPRVVLPRIGEAGADAAARLARRLSKVSITGRFQGGIHSVNGELVIGF
jgi:hypothetical protein